MVPLSQQLACQTVIAITDAWVIETPRFYGSGLAYVPWFPCDGTPMDEANARGIRGPGPAVTYPVATSDHAAAMARERGITDQTTIHYMVDTNVFKPGDVRQARNAWGIPQDAFVVGIVAMNKVATGIDRKRFFEQIGAFSRFRKRHPEAMLYLHTHMVAPDGAPIPDYLNYWKVPAESVIATNGLLLTVGAFPEQMAELYNGFDVLCGVTGGEGAGMPHLEAAACGVPSIWGDWTAMPEYAKSGWHLSLNESVPEMNLGRVIWQKPSIEAIDDRLEAAFSASQDDRQRMTELAIARAGEHSPAVTMEKRWLPAIAEVEDRLNRAGEVQTVEVPEILRTEVPA